MCCLLYFTMLFFSSLRNREDRLSHSASAGSNMLGFIENEKSGLCLHFSPKPGIGCANMPNWASRKGFQENLRGAGAEAGSRSPFWERHMAALPSISPTEGGPDSLTPRPRAGGRALQRLSPQPAALKQEFTLKRPRFE